jgi:hypothetical protein
VGVADSRARDGRCVFYAWTLRLDQASARLLPRARLRSASLDRLAVGFHGDLIVGEREILVRNRVLRQGDGFVRFDDERQQIFRERSHVVIHIAP